MGRNRFVHAPAVRLPVSDGDWIEVKKELTVGEQKAFEAAGTTPKWVDHALLYVTDWAIAEIIRNFLWMTAWSFRDAMDKPVDLTLDAVRALDTDTFKEITKAINGHIEALLEEKKTRLSLRGTPTGSPPDSGSSGTTSGS